ncbi:MAG TPA: hypothetical protein VLM85_04215, partial [Polyangiaceae bacterium]|nr:hypothetical protein [Polyangiaceae bacterium]
TTGELHVAVGEPIHATELPLVAATIRGEKANVFVVEGDVAHQRVFGYVGEVGGSVFLDSSLAPGTLVVTEGRALLNDGDKVSAKVAEPSEAKPKPDEPKPKPE